MARLPRRTDQILDPCAAYTGQRQRPATPLELALRPHGVDLDLGTVAPYPAGSPEAFEVRAFFPKDGVTVADPVTGSLTASLAQ